jgi:hypothetical protein
VADFSGTGGRLKMESPADFSGICSSVNTDQERIKKLSSDSDIEYFVDAMNGRCQRLESLLEHLLAKNTSPEILIDTELQETIESSYEINFETYQIMEENNKQIKTYCRFS